MQDWAGLSATEWAALLGVMQQKSYLRCSDLATNKKMHYLIQVVDMHCENSSQTL
jgi:hypothetical protein